MIQVSQSYYNENSQSKLTLMIQVSVSYYNENYQSKF